MQSQDLTTHSREAVKHRTHSKIKNAMLLLMSEKPVDSITITELSRVAGVNRKTFYSHFETVDAVIAELEDDFVHTMFALFGRENLPAYFGAPQLFFRVLIESFNENSEQLRLLILTGEHNRLLVKVKDRILQILGETVSELDGRTDRNAFLYRTEFIAGGIIAVLERWASGPEHLPFSTVSQVIWQMLEHIDSLF